MNDSPRSLPTVSSYRVVDAVECSANVACVAARAPARCRAAAAAAAGRSTWRTGTVVCGARLAWLGRSVVRFTRVVGSH